MENFNEFELQNQEMIFGGEHQNTRYTTDGGTSGKDLYDTEAHTIVYFEPDSP